MNVYCLLIKVARDGVTVSNFPRIRRKKRDKRLHDEQKVQENPRRER